ncbi:MAG: 2-hydroxychromene-2-carboxylate isomerase [Burkholderiaceae bacterium]
MTKSCEFFFDVGSPAAYIAYTQLHTLAGEVKLRPMLLGGVFHATGNHSPTTVPAKGSYMMDDLSRFAKRYGVQFNNNPHFPINTLMLMRGATGLQMRDEAKLVPYLDAVFRAIWVDGQDMNDPQVVGKVLHGAGFDPTALLALTQEAAVKDELKRVTQEAIDRGAFGAPTFFAGGQMFWGQDRLDFVKESLQ